METRSIVIRADRAEHKRVRRRRAGAISEAMAMNDTGHDNITALDGLDERGKKKKSKTLLRILCFAVGLGPSLTWSCVVASSSVFAKLFQVPMCMAWLGLTHTVSMLSVWLIWTLLELFAQLQRDGRFTRCAGIFPCQIPNVTREDGLIAKGVSIMALVGQVATCLSLALWLKLDGEHLVFLYVFVFVDGAFAAASGGALLRFANKLGGVEEDLFFLANALVGALPLMLWGGMIFMPAPEAIIYLFFFLAGVQVLTALLAVWLLREGQSRLDIQSAGTGGITNRGSASASTETDSLLLKTTVDARGTTRSESLISDGDGLLSMRDDNQASAWVPTRSAILLLIPLGIVLTRALSSAVLGVAAKVHGDMALSMRLVGSYQISEVIGRGIGVWLNRLNAACIHAPGGGGLTGITLVRFAVLGGAPLALISDKASVGESLAEACAYAIYITLALSQGYLGVVFPVTGVRLNAGGQSIPVTVLSFFLGFVGQVATLGGFALAFPYGDIAETLARQLQG